MRCQAEPLRLAAFCLALVLVVALGSTAVGATSMASAEDFTYGTNVPVATLPRVVPVVVDENGSLGLARSSYDATVDVAPESSVESPGLEPRTDQASTVDVGISGHVLDLSADLVAPRTGALFDDAAGVAHTRSAELQAALPSGSQGRVTMSAGGVEDAAGTRIVVVATSEPNG